MGLVGRWGSWQKAKRMQLPWIEDNLEKGCWPIWIKLPVKVCFSYVPFAFHRGGGRWSLDPVALWWRQGGIHATSTTLPMTRYTNQGLMVSKDILQMKAGTTTLYHLYPIDSYYILQKIGSTHSQLSSWQGLPCRSTWSPWRQGHWGSRWKGMAIFCLSFSFFPCLYKEVIHKRERTHHDSYLILFWTKKIWDTCIVFLYDIVSMILLDVEHFMHLQKPFTLVIVLCQALLKSRLNSTTAGWVRGAFLPHKHRGFRHDIRYNKTIHCNSVFLSTMFMFIWIVFFLYADDDFVRERFQFKLRIRVSSLTTHDSYSPPCTSNLARVRMKISWNTHEFRKRAITHAIFPSQHSLFFFKNCLY